MYMLMSLSNDSDARWSLRTTIWNHSAHLKTHFGMLCVSCPSNRITSPLELSLTAFIPCCFSHSHEQLILIAYINKQTRFLWQARIWRSVPSTHRLYTGFILSAHEYCELISTIKNLDYRVFLKEKKKKGKIWQSVNPKFHGATINRSVAGSLKWGLRVPGSHSPHHSLLPPWQWGFMQSNRAHSHHLYGS